MDSVLKADNKTEIGTVYGKGYIIRRAKLFINSYDKDMVDPQASILIEAIADLVWVHKSNDSWVHSNEIKLEIDIDKEKFFIKHADKCLDPEDDQEIEVINGKEILTEIMRMLIGLKQT